MTIRTSKAKEYGADYLGGPTRSGGAVMLKIIMDGRRLPEIAAEFDGLDWIERISDDEGNKRFEGYTRLAGIVRVTDGVTMELVKEG